MLLELGSVIADEGFCCDEKKAENDNTPCVANSNDAQQRLCKRPGCAHLPYNILGRCRICRGRDAGKKMRQQEGAPK